MNTAFGGGMSSRLFQGLREKEGLVYNVQSFLDFYSDCGLSGFYFVCDKANLKGVAKQLKAIFIDLQKNGFHKDEIELAKTYLSGNLLLSLESSTNRMLRLGREMLNFKKTTSVDDVIKTIHAIDEQHINNLIAQYLNPKNFTIAAVGPITRKEINDIFRT
jgi:predicted Zn-dependent peptidase